MLKSRIAAAAALTAVMLVPTAATAASTSWHTFSTGFGTKFQYCRTGGSGGAYTVKFRVDATRLTSARIRLVANATGTSSVARTTWSSGWMTRGQIRTGQIYVPKGKRVNWDYGNGGAGATGSVAPTSIGSCSSFGGGIL